MNQHRLGLTDGVRKLIIDGKLVMPVDGQTFGTYNPSTGALLATVAQGGVQDIDLAVAAARRAFEGPWSKFTPFQRQETILKFADLVDRHFEEFSMLDTLDMGMPITMTRGRRQRAIGMIRFYASMCTAIAGRFISHER